MKMKFTVTSCLLLGLLLIKNNCQAQANLYRNVLPDGSLKKKYKEAKNNKNEIEMAFSSLFLVYKTFFSSQDLTVCTFTPSCSAFGILAVKQFGVVKGGIMTMDRLSRCNGLTPENYEIDKKTMLLIDYPGHMHFVPIVSTIK